VDKYEAVQVDTNTWMVKWYEDSDTEAYLESLMKGNFKDSEEAIDAAILRGSWA
jgi:hypothetical protein